MRLISVVDAASGPCLLCNDPKLAGTAQWLVAVKGCADPGYLFVKLRKGAVMSPIKMARKDIVMLHIPFAWAEAIRRSVERVIGQELLHRGEAHITVLSPGEVRVAGVSAAELLDACWAKLETAQWDAEWVGSATVGDSTAYFIIIESTDLEEIRGGLGAAFAIPGFRVEDQQFHVTLGYTLRDVFPKDGKGIESRKWRIGELRTGRVVKHGV